MAANRFDQAAQMPILNTYVPINFGELYRIGATQKAAVDQAIADMGTAVQQFGEFRSPSRVDTENYYNMTLGKMQDLIDQMASNPDSIKDASVRSRFYGRLNSLDYAGLSLLKESADNLRAGLKMRAEMKAKGLYNENWDDSNIEQYDTLGNRAVFSDITPVAYMNANQLSNPYFDNLSKGTIGSTWKDGVKYTVTGNTVDDLRAVADARYSDIVNTPQGQKYYQQFLRENNGNAEAATRAFKDMIVASQIDRTLRPTLTVDPAWLAQLRATASRRTSGINDAFATPTRLRFIREGNLRVAQRNLRNNATEEDIIKHNEQQAALESNFMNAYNRYVSNPTDDNLVQAKTAQNAVYLNQGRFLLDNNRKEVDKQFKSVTGRSVYDQFPDKMNHRDYVTGVNKALSSVENDIALTKQDKLVTNLGALPVNVTDEGNATKQAFQFNTSAGFVTPERIMQMITDPTGEKVPTRDVKRGTWWLGSESIGFDNNLTGGSFGTTQFIPDNKIIQVSPDVYALKGKIRISRDEIEDVLGTGSWFSRESDQGARGLLGSQRTDDVLRGAYNMREVKERSGDDEVTYYEVDGYRLLPSVTENPEWWVASETGWANTDTYGGMGSATMAKDAFSSSSALNLGY